MAIFDRLIAPRVSASAPFGPLHDFWYSDVSEFMLSSSGVPVTPDAALKIAVAFRCIGIVSDGLGQLPLHLYQRLDNGGKQRVTEHPVDRLLSESPNGWQTAVEWRTQGQTHILLRGNTYNVLAGPAGRFLREIRPLNPDRMRQPELRNWQMHYEYAGDDNQPAGPIAPDQMFHIRGLSLDGVTGVSVFRYARESWGRKLAIHQYGSRFFSQAGTPAGYLQTDQPLTAEQAKEHARAWHEARSGLRNAHKIAVLGRGLQFHPISINPEDAQMVASDEATAYEVCSWFGVPPHMAGLTTRSTSWGTGIEQQVIGFVVFTLAAWASRWEQRANLDLLLPEERRRGLFVEHVMAGLLRGDARARASFYKTMREIGAYSINDILRKENENEIDAEWANRHIVPMNFRDADAASPVAPGATRAEQFARAAARVVVRREVAAMQKAAQRCGADVAAWRAAVGQFYDQHVLYVIEHMLIERRQAERYCRQQADALIEQGAAAMIDWEARRVDDLTALALGETNAIASAT